MHFNILTQISCFAEYVAELMERVMVERQECTSYRKQKVNRQAVTKAVPKPIAHAYNEDKEKLVANMVSRFQRSGCQ